MGVCAFGGNPRKAPLSRGMGAILASFSDFIRVNTCIGVFLRLPARGAEGRSESAMARTGARLRASSSVKQSAIKNAYARHRSPKSAKLVATKAIALRLASAAPQQSIPTAIFKTLLISLVRVRSYPCSFQIKRSLRTSAFAQGRSVFAHACKRGWDGRLVSLGGRRQRRCAGGYPIPAPSSWPGTT